MNYICILSSYRAVNTLVLGNKKKTSVTVVQGGGLLSFSGIHTKYKRALFGQEMKFLKLNLRDVYSDIWALEG